MGVQDLGLILLGVLSLASAIGVIASREAVYSALCLVVNLLTVAAAFFLLDARFLGAAQVLVYAGAIMVLFLFAVTLLAPEEEPLRFGRGHPVATAGILLAGLLALGLGGVALSQATPVEAHQAFDGSVEGFARLILGPFVLPFEATAFLLLVAVLGGVMLGRSGGEGAPPRGAGGWERTGDG